MRLLILLSLFVGPIYSSVGQGLTDDMKATEAQLRASTKQVNQFFRRFNGEEDENGNRYYPEDKNFREAALRRKYVPVLFDTETSQLDMDLVKAFVKQTTNKKSPRYLDFHTDHWFAEVNTTFRLDGKKITGTLYMRLQAQGQGYEWVIEDVSFSHFSQFFDKDTSPSKKFIHPMSHELDFMPLKKAFEDNRHNEQFTLDDYKPDYLTLFLYELNQGRLKFETVKNVRFHFFAIDGYYFALDNFNRSGFNSGWLISDLVLLENAEQKKQMLDYIYGRN